MQGPLLVPRIIWAALFASTLIYIVAHKSKDAAAAAWAAFVADPEWKTAYAASIADGRLVTNIDSVFMAATDYSPVL